MSIVTEKSPITAIPELDFYARTPVQNSIESTYEEEIRPISQLNSGGHYEFIIHNAINEYVKLNETTLYIRFRVRLIHKNNTAITAADWNSVSVVNNLLHSLWSQIDLSIGESQVTTSLQTYPYRAYFETILKSTPHARRTYKIGQMYDEEDLSSTPDALNDTRKNIIKHKTSDTTTEISLGAAIELQGKLHLDLLLQNRALIGGTRLKLKFVPQRPEFYFMTSDVNIYPKIEFEEMFLNVVKFRVSEEVLEAQLYALNVSPVKYILNRSEVRAVTIDRGVSSYNVENVINGILPRRVYIAFVKNDSYGGSFTKNPYNFEHNNINSIACFINGQQYPRKPYIPDFAKDKYVLRPYLELLRVSEQYNSEVSTVITKDKFLKGYTIFAFNLSRDLSQGYQSAGYVNIPTNGVMRFEIHFATQLVDTINAVIFCEFDNQISILEDRNAIMDYR